MEMSHNYELETIMYQKYVNLWHDEYVSVRRLTKEIASLEEQRKREEISEQNNAPTDNLDFMTALNKSIDAYIGVGRGYCVDVLFNFGYGGGLSAIVKEDFFSIQQTDGEIFVGNNKEVHVGGSIANFSADIYKSGTFESYSGGDPIIHAPT